MKLKQAKIEQFFSFSSANLNRITITIHKIEKYQIIFKQLNSFPLKTIKIEWFSIKECTNWIYTEHDFILVKKNVYLKGLKLCILNLE